MLFKQCLHFVTIEACWFFYFINRPTFRKKILIHFFGTFWVRDYQSVQTFPWSLAIRLNGLMLSVNVSVNCDCISIIWYITNKVARYCLSLQWSCKQFIDFSNNFQVERDFTVNQGYDCLYPLQYLPKCRGSSTHQARSISYHHFKTEI